MFRAFRQPTSFESVYVDFIHLFTAVRFSSWFWITPIPLQIIDTNVSSFNGNIDGVALFSSIFTHLLHCASDFFEQKSLLSNQEWHHIPLLLLCPAVTKNWKLSQLSEPLDLEDLGEPNRLSTRRELQSSLPVTLLVCVDHQIQDVTCEINPIPPEKRFFWRSFQFWEMTNQRLQYTCKNQWSLLACSTASLNLPQMWVKSNGLSYHKT